MVVGRLLSYWGPVTFQGRAVKHRGGYLSRSKTAVIHNSQLHPLRLMQTTLTRFSSMLPVGTCHLCTTKREGRPDPSNTAASNKNRPCLIGDNKYIIYIFKWSQNILKLAPHQVETLRNHWLSSFFFELLTINRQKEVLKRSERQMMSFWGGFLLLRRHRRGEISPKWIGDIKYYQTDSNCGEKHE